MNPDPVISPPTRSWRDIPQAVKPRAMSRGGRWRLAMAGLRTAGVVVVLGGVAWGAWQLAGSLGANPRAMPEAARAVPMRPAEVRTVLEGTGVAGERLAEAGVLDAVWLMNTLALPRNTSLMELDLLRLREVLLANPQVKDARLTRIFPDRLVVDLTERRPIARVMAEWDGQKRAIFVARDGAVFDGYGYTAENTADLPWLDGVALARKGGRFQPLAGLPVVDELLTRARLDTERIHRTWSVVSLARLEADGEIEVRTKSPLEMTLVFSTPSSPGQGAREFTRQLAKLDYLWTRLTAQPATRLRVDLSLGREVAVRAEEPRPAESRLPGAATTAHLAPGTFNFLPSSPQPRTKS